MATFVSWVGPEEFETKMFRLRNCLMEVCSSHPITTYLCMQANDIDLLGRIDGLSFRQPDPGETDHSDHNLKGYIRMAGCAGEVAIYEGVKAHWQMNDTRCF
jgi:hypothetical protein